MPSQHQPGLVPQVWADWHAGLIRDPVRRLRFLKSVAPQIETAPPAAKRMPRRLLSVVLLTIAGCAFLVGERLRVEPLPNYRRRITPPTQRADGLPGVWLVEKTSDSETYSNGLRVHYRVFTHQRSYVVFPVDRPEETAGERRTQPAGIVFHTTESRQAPFAEEQTRVLKHIGESLLEYVQRRHAYNFVIDRFGRVYQVVSEGDAANHSGYSVWADTQKLYINLNESFLGVSFEAQTNPGQEEASVSPGQVRAAAMLTEMLRSRYAIAANNCVTHAQVSVNPSNMHVGLHTDWASSFPFEQVGLPNNYAQPLAALALFGFEYDSAFEHWAGTRVFAGVEAAEELARDKAAHRGLDIREYRTLMQRLYREKLARLGLAVSSSAEDTE